MATKPLPTIATDSQGRPVKQDSGEALLKNNAIIVDVQKTQLDILTDILGVVKNIADNIIAGMRAQGLVYASMQSYLDTAREDTKNKLAEAEKEKESKLGAGAAAKPESFLDSLKKFFKGFFGIFNILKALLIPLIFGLVAGFRKKFDLLTVAISLAILYPIRTFKLMVRVFGFLFEALKSVGKLISKIGPTFQDAVQGITNFFRRMRIFFLRTLDLKNILKPITSLFSSGAGIFQGLAKMLGGIFRLFGKLFLPLTIIMAVYDGIMGAIEGYKEGGMLGAIKGALVGILDGLVGWLVGIGQWIVSNLLELFGFDELAKTVDQFNFKEFLKEYGAFFIPFLGLLDLFDESSPIRRQFAAALDKISDVGDFVSSIWDSFTEAIRNILIKIGKAIPGGSALLKALGLKDEDPSEKAQGRKLEPTIYMDEETRKKYDAIDTGNEQVDNLARSALETGNQELYEELTGEGIFDTAEDTETAKKLMMEKGGYTAEQVERLAQTGYVRGRPQAPVPVPPPNKAEQIDEKTRDAETAKKPEPPKPTQNNTTVVNAPNNSKTTANMNPAPHADRVGIGSRGNAGYSGFSKAYT